jgi:hypothetical protein
MNDPVAAIDIYIDVLQIEGLSHADALRVRHDIERDLARLVRENGLPSGAAQLRSFVTVDLESGRQALDGGRGPLGERIASAIYRALIQ